MPFPTCNNALSLNGLHRINFTKIKTMNLFVIFENEKNARALSLENICIVWRLRACEVIRLTWSVFGLCRMGCSKGGLLCNIDWIYTDTPFSFFVSCCMHVHSKNTYVVTFRCDFDASDIWPDNQHLISRNNFSSLLADMIWEICSGEKLLVLK